MTITPQSGATNLGSPIQVIGTCNSTSCPNLRVDNIAFSGWSTGPTRIYNGWLILADNLFGVIDHNTVTQAGAGSGGSLVNVGHSSYLGVGQYGDNSWAQPDTFGTNSALYIEDNSLNGGPNLMAITDCDHADSVTDVGGCRMVIRHNTLNNATVQTHGTETTGRPRGARQVEVYGNAFTCTNNTSGCATATNMRSGVALNYSNTYTTSGGSWYNTYLQLDAYRVFSGTGGWEYCAGQGQWDSNDGVAYAFGTFTGVSITGGTITLTDSAQNWSANQWVVSGNPYSIVDISVTTSGGYHPGYEITASGSNSVSASGYGQDYWDGPPTLNIGDKYQILRAAQCIDQPSRSGGTLLSGFPPRPSGWVNEILDPSYEWDDKLAGVRYGSPVASDTAKIIVNRDFYYQGASFNGTTGTGSGLLSARPATCTPRVAYWATDTNTLYQCTAINKWTAYYTPYAYPHPLTQGQDDPPDPPTDLQAAPQ